MHNTKILQCCTLTSVLKLQLPSSFHTMACPNTWELARAWMLYFAHETHLCVIWCFECRGSWTSSLLIKSHNRYPSFLCRWYSTTHPSPTTTINLNCALPTCCFQPNSPSFNCLLVHKQWIRIGHSSVLHTQLDKWVAQYMPSKMNTVKWCSSRLKFSISMYAQKCTSVITMRERNCDVHPTQKPLSNLYRVFFLSPQCKNPRKKQPLVLWSFIRRYR